MPNLKCLTALLLLISAGLLQAEVQVKVVDQNDQPVENAVISIPDASISRTNSAPAVMDQVNKQFVPHVLSIQQGQAVHFPNSDNIRHHVYSFSEAKPFEIKLYSEYTTDPIVFDKAGIAILGCNIHDHMVGYIYISNNETNTLSDENGIATLKQTVGENLQIWHPRLSETATERQLVKLVNKDASGIWQVKVNLRPEVKKTSRTFKPRFN